MTVDLQSALSGKWETGTRPKDLFAQHVAVEPEAHVEPLLAGLACDDRKVSNGCSELVSLLSEVRPELFVEHVDLFVDGLGSKHKVIRWEAVCTLGNLAPVLSEARAAAIVPAITGFLRADSIVLQGHAVRALAKIGLAHPAVAGGIFDALTGAVDAFGGNKVGFVIEALGDLAAVDGLAGPVRAFVAPYAEHEVAVVVRKAKKVLRKLG